MPPCRCKPQSSSPRSPTATGWKASRFMTSRERMTARMTLPAVSIPPPSIRSWQSSGASRGCRRGRSIAVLLAVHDQRRRFVLTRDGSESPYMARFACRRGSTAGALGAAARCCNRLQAKDLDFVHLSRQRPAELKQLATRVSARKCPSPAPSYGPMPPAAGSPTGGITENGREYRWQIRGVSFDEAFRDAMRGAARILSGNGAP